MDGRTRHDGAVLDGIEPNANVDELPRPKLAISVGESGFESDRASLRIDAIIEDRKDALLPQSLPVCIERRHRDLPFGERMIHRPEMLLRQGKGDGDRFQLRDDDYSTRLPRANEISCVNEPHSCAPGNRRPDAGVFEFQRGCVDIRLVRL